ncbi:cytochrome ubiquinol oxidase subunit I [Blastococcus brunescens]|uniref:Cytochrome ubiquinol oxidase subunit I n=1 Tax=Blastococcus brunescens TaxID=1564165 RepID=A0ABZ1AXE6_9ACTN|nr:cytochrome ubiquinol oxidase subunit I [Blastococcus sp. BMG 8361]WRL61804.1 cytochrome ubiquinol oxidase subunit I [Blastococcus sp. BMG 8361]
MLFAVGAVSGTVLSFELGLLWPRLMGTYGAAFGLPFAVEGLFFFLEAIFVAIYLYGWKRMRPWPHFWAGVPIVLSGIGGTASVVAANGWMNQPAGFTMRDGEVVDVRPGRCSSTGASGTRPCTCCSRPTWWPASSSPPCTPSACCADVGTGTTGWGWPSP